MKMAGGVSIKKLFAFLLIMLLSAGCQPNNENLTDTPPAVLTPAPPPAAAPTQAPEEADWTLYVDDTIETNIEGISIIYTFTLDAVKHGGTTDIGSYTGTASLKQKMDAGGLSGQVVTVIGGVETDIRSDNVQIDIVAYDREKYDDFGMTEGEVPSSLLIEPDSMALGSITMSGSGNFDVSAYAPQNTHTQLQFNKNGTGALNYKLNVEGGQVSVTIPMLNLPDSFKGMITGVPKN